MANKFQTFNNFMRMPFNKDSSLSKNEKYNKKYEEYRKENKIYIAAYTEIEDSYYLHIKVPSSTLRNGKYEYDVVIRFFTDDLLVKKEASLTPYYIQFFSNSPGFIYYYAALYKKHGFLIEALYDKLDPDYKDVMPEKTNPDNEVSYDKSIYFACKFISEHKFRILNKRGLLLQKKVKPDKFFANISDFRSAKLDRELIKSDEALRKELDKKASDKRSHDLRTIADKHRISAKKGKISTSGLSKSVTGIVKKVAKGKIKPKKKIGRKRKL